MNAVNAPATVRISGPPNSSFLVGYPGISATLVRLAVHFDCASASASGSLGPLLLGPCDRPS